MTIKAHLAELERQHKALEHEIAKALAHSSTDDLKITELKRRKLILKDESSVCGTITRYEGRDKVLRRSVEITRDKRT